MKKGFANHLEREAQSIIMTKYWKFVLLCSQFQKSSLPLPDHFWICYCEKWSSQKILIIMLINNEIIIKK